MTTPAPARPWWLLAGTLLLAALLWATPLNERWSRPLLDVQLRLLGAAQTTPAGVLVLDIDDASLSALAPRFGPWPWGRDAQALLVEQLRGLGARAVALNLLLVDPRPGDAALAQALARDGAPVVLAGAGLPQAVAAVAQGAALPATGGQALADRPGQAMRWPALLPPARTLWPSPDRMPPWGLVTLSLDDDGQLRRLPLWHAADGAHWPALPLALLAAADGEAAVTRLRQARTDAVWLALPPATAWVPVLPAAALAVLDRGAPPPEALRQAVQGRVVLVGSSALQAEAVMTAQGQWPATQVQAQAYAALRDGLWAQPPSALAALLLMALALLPSAVLVTRGQAEARRDMGVTAAALLAMTGMVAGGLLLWRQPALLAAPLLTLAGGVALMLLAQQRLLQARQQQVLQALAVAEASAAARRQVLAQVSHEVRTPLHALLGVADLLADGPLAPAQQQQVRVLRDAGHSLLALINDLLDLARIDAGRLVLTRQPFSLSAMLSHLEALMRPRAQGQGLALRFELAADLPDGVLGDHQRLSQGLANLLGNALKFTRQGQVLLRVQRAAPSGDELLFEVVDTGIGIAPSKLDQVFEPFAQADDSVARQYGGTGLGLAITRRVAQQMGGSLTVRSSPGQGSAFCLRLPLPVAVLPQPPAEPADGAALLDTGGRTLRVLLAEDNPVNVMLFEAQLAGQPLVIDTVVDGREALARLTERAYDLAFLDVEMPHLDGLGVTRALRQLEARTGRRRTPVVVVTANAYPDDIARSQAAGSDRHVAKPFGRAVLLQALQQLACPPAAAGPAAAAVATPAEPAPPAVPLLDVALALHQLGGDAAAFGRAADHAEVFLAGWDAALAAALLARDHAQAARLADDLATITRTLGATALSRQAQALVPGLVTGQAEARALAQLRARLPQLRADLARLRPP